MKHNWTYKKFSEVFNLQMGKTPSRDKLSYWGGDNIWVSIADMKGKYIDSTKEHITDFAVSESKIHKVPQGTTIMSFKLTIGRAAIAKCDLFTNEAIMSFEPKDANILLPDYVFYYLKGCKWAGANKAVMGQTLNKKTISENTFAYPPLSTQSRIVSELDLLQSIIDKQQAQLKELDTLAQAVFYDMFGDPVENERGWETAELNDVCDVRDGTHDSPKYHEDGYPLITSKNIIDGKISFDEVNYISKEDFDNISKRSKVDNGDIIMPMIGTIGKPTIVKKEREFAIKNVALIKFVPNSRVLNTFIQTVINSDAFDSYMKSKNKGGTQKFIALGDIRKLKVQIPPLSLQQSFTEKIESIEKQKAAISQSIAETQKLFDYTMDKYFG